MTDHHSLRPDPNEIVDLDDCSKKNSIIVGGITAFLFTIVPIFLGLCCLPLVVASLVGVYNFTKNYSITISVKEGIKIGILSCMLGYGASILVYDIVWAVSGYQIGMEIYVNILEKFLEVAPPEVHDQVQGIIEEVKSKPFSVFDIVGQLFSLVLASAIGGAIGGSLGALFFKKGPLAE